MARCLLGWALTLAVGGSAFDIDTENVAAQVVLPSIVPWVYADISAGGGDASLVLRFTTAVSNCFFDATAPFDASAVGVYSRFERRPIAERTVRNMNTAMLYAAHAVLTDAFPRRWDQIDSFLTGNGLDVHSPLKSDPSSPVGIGAAAGEKVVEARRHDGMNSVGDHARERNFEPFSDTTGYRPVNTAHALNDASRWQPDVQRKGQGVYKIQQFVTPQWGVTEPYSYADPNAWRVPRPASSSVDNTELYKKQADEVLAASAALTERQKLMAELFDDKVKGIGGSIAFKTLSTPLSILDFARMAFVTNVAAFDAGIFIWNEKRRWDAVRPFTAIKHIYGNETVRAWGGPGQGTVDMKASDWKSLFEEADHPEYPSATACFCHAHSQAARKFFGSDALGFAVSWTAGSSMAEPGITPSVDTTIAFPTWTQFTQDCAQSRMWGGVHFQAAIDASAGTCDRFGDTAYDFLLSLLNGTSPVRQPARPLPIPSFYNEKPGGDGVDDSKKGKRGGHGKKGKWHRGSSGKKGGDKSKWYGKDKRH